MQQQEQALEVIRGAEKATALLQRTRRLMLAHLGEPQSAAGLSRKLGLPRQRLNYHLRELERQGLVECVEERRKGNCTERLMRVTARSFVISPEALGAVGNAEASGDHLSAAYAIGLAARVIRDVSTLEARARKQGKRLATFAIETELRFPTAQARAAFAEELAAAIATVVARHHDARAPGGRSFRLVTAVHPVLATDAPSPAPIPESTQRRRR
jgi:DNA-binding transcriptional ArsR family regulator